MIEWVASSCILILAVIALRYLLRGRISLRLQYALWLLVLARLLIPVSFGSTDISVMSVVEKAPAVQAVESVRNVDTIWQADNGTVEGYPAGPLMPDTPVTVVTIAPGVTNDQFGRMESALTLRKLLLPVWWCGAAVTLMVFLTANLRFAARLRKSRRSLTVEGAALSVYVAQERAVPCLFGLFRPVIYVTQAAADDPELLRHTVAHETTHFRQGDHVWALLRTVCLALHWWNPLVWWAAKLSRQDGELACDEATIRALGESERAAYGRTLIRMACGPGSHVLLTATTMDGGKTSLHERIVLLAKKPRTAVTAAIVVALAAALCVACTFTGAKKDEAAAEPDTLAGYMAALTVDDVTDWDVTEYPDITLGRLVTAMNDAAAYEITAEEALGYGENGQEWFVSLHADGHELMLNCGDMGGIVHVVDLSAALSSDAVPPERMQAYFRHDTLYNLIRHAQDSVETTDTGESAREILQRIGWPDKAELSTEIFTYRDLKVQVTRVYQTGKGVVKEGEAQVFENDIFVICPGAVLTVLECGSENDVDGVSHANWRYYIPNGDMTELWPGDEFVIEGNSSIGAESFPVLRFCLYDGWLQAPSADPLESARAAIEGEAQKGYARNIRVDSLSVNEAETKRVAQERMGSELAIARGWSDDMLDDHFVVVDAAYYIEYDHTRTPLEGGNVTQQFYLMQNEDGRWIIVDNAMRSADRQDSLPLEELMASVKPEDLGDIDPYLYPKVTARQVTDALNSAARHWISKEWAQTAEGYPGCDYPFWGMNIDGVDLYVKCGLAENVVWVRDKNGGEGYFKDETLYELVRHCRDYDEVIDQAAYARFKPQVDAVMQQALDDYATSPGEFHAYQLTNFSPVWTYATDDGNRAEWYSFDFALIPDRPEVDFWAGGIYMDSQLRVRGFNDCGNVVARYQGDTLLGLVFMQYDNFYWPSFDEDWDWANAMLAAAEGI